MDCLIAACRNSHISLADIRTVVLDEADEMLRMGFQVCGCVCVPACVYVCTRVCVRVSMDVCVCV